MAHSTWLFLERIGQAPWSGDVVGGKIWLDGVLLTWISKNIFLANSYRPSFVGTFCQKLHLQVAHGKDHFLLGGTNFCCPKRPVGGIWEPCLASPFLSASEGESHGNGQSVKPSRPRPEDRQVGNGAVGRCWWWCFCCFFPHDLLRCLHQTTHSLSLFRRTF